MIDNLPNVWKIEYINDIFKLKQGNHLSINDLEEDGYFVYGANGIIGKYHKYMYEDSKVLITCRGATCGTINISKPKSWITGNAIALTEKKDYIDENYVAYFLRKDKLQSVISGSAQPQITVTNLSKLKIPIPPLQQQEKIVKVLDLTSNLIEKQKELLKNYDLFLKSKFIEMFGDPISNPMGWKIEKIGNITKLQTGKTPSRQKSKYWENGNINWAKTTEVNQSILTYTEEFITELALKECKLITFPVNTILMAMYGQGKTRGKVVITKIETAINQAFGAILPNDTYNSLYLLKVLDLMYQDIRDLARGGNQENLNMDIVKNIKIIFPPLELQNKFASIVEKIETIKEKENQKLKQLEDLHNSLMQKAFKGEIK